MRFILEYTKQDGERIKGQLITADNLTKTVNNLITWGCHHIEIRSVDD